MSFIKEVVKGMVVLWCLLGLVQALQFSVSDQSAFDQGTYDGTFYNTTSQALHLLPSTIMGTYTSTIFDSLDTSQWVSLTVNQTLVELPLLVTVDVQDDIWTSRDGISWTFLRDNYNNGDGGNDAQFVFADFQNIFYSIENDDDVWKSVDGGLNWTKVNDDYNGELQSVIRAVADYNNYLYIIEGDEDVWKSVDGGLNWTKTSVNFNAVAGNVAGFVVNSSNTLIVIDAAADVWTSTDGINWTLFIDDYNGGELNNPGYLVIDSQDTLYSIENDDDIWQSTDGGLTWTKVNDDYNGELQSVTRATIDSLNNFYIIEGDEDVWKSVDGGLNWTKVNGSDFNGGNGDVRGLFALNSTTNIALQARSCALADCSDASFSDTNVSLNFSSNRYFQLLLNLTTSADDITPFLYSVLIDFTDVGSPQVGAVEPMTGNFSLSDLVEINATISDGRQLDTILLNMTLPNGTSALLSLMNSSISFYALSYNASLTGDYLFTLLANDTSNNLNDTVSGSFTVTEQNQSSGSSGGSSGSGSSSGSNLGSDSGPGALRNAPPGTPVIGNQPQPRQQSPPPSPPQGAPIVQQQVAGEINPLTGAAIGQQESIFTFKKITFALLILALLSFIISYFLRERRSATKHLYMHRRPQKIMVKNPEVLDKLQGYVSAEILNRLKKGDQLQQKRVDPKDKEFAHQFPETAKELQEKKIQINPKRFNYERLEQVKRDINKQNKVISAADMKKIFPDTLGQTPRLHQERFVLTPHAKDIRHRVAEDDFSKHYVLKQPEKPAPKPEKQTPQTSRKVNKTSKDALLKGLQEVYKLD